LSDHYLLDTNVLSLFAPGRPDLTPEFATWVANRDEDLFVSVISMTELQQGVVKLSRNSGGGRARTMRLWLEATVTLFERNLVDVTTDVARTAGDLSDYAHSIGRHPGLADLLIAATAQVHSLTLLTRNVRHFEPLGIDVVDPLVQLPG
jgi:predicted nucleic acid-binding protein